MTNFENIKAMSVEELASWLDKHGRFDNSPWIAWFDTLYCGNCEPIICHYPESKREFSCSYCELEGQCKFFPDMDHVPDNEDIIKMWLQLEVE